MKKIISTMLVCVLLLGCVFTLASCSRLSGTYSNVEDGTGTTYEFDGDQLVMKTYLLGVKTAEVEGTYEIKDDEIIITWETVGGKEVEARFEFERGFDDGKAYIEINDDKYIKE